MRPSGRNSIGPPLLLTSFVLLIDLKAMAGNSEKDQFYAPAISVLDIAMKVFCSLSFKAAIDEKQRQTLSNVYSLFLK